MPTHKRGHEDADDNHVKASEDIPRPKKLRKNPVEKSSDEQKEPRDDHMLQKCQASEDIPRPNKLRKKPVEKSRDEQKKPLHGSWLEKCQALRKKPVEKSVDEQKEPLDDPRFEKCQASEDNPQPKKLRKNPVEKSSDEQKEPLDDPIAETLCQPARFVQAKQTENLSKLPYELLVEIAMRLKKLEDFTCFRSVSRSFHLNVKEEYFEGLPFRKSLPYLMLPPVSSSDSNDDIRREFYSLVEGESIVASLEVPAFKTSTKMCFESLGWLLTVELDGSMSLLDPFSDIKIPLPHMYTFPRTELITYDKRFLIKKMVLSSRPNESTDFILMIIIGDCNHLAFWRLGDKAWNKIDDERRGNRDVLYVGGEQFYAINARGIIWAINLVGGHVELRNIMDCTHILRTYHEQGQYILKSMYGSLLGITRSRDEKFYLTSEFRVYDIDIKTGLSREIYSLGNMAIFLGRNSSFAVDATASASNGGGIIKANHIYFTDDFGDYQLSYFKGDQWRSLSRGSRYVKGGSVDNGVFNFETGDIEPFYLVKPLMSNVCPAMWITPNLCL